jgi:hypothetical protein
MTDHFVEVPKKVLSPSRGNTMTTPPDFRALCAEFVEICKHDRTYTQTMELVARADAALATPPPEPPKPPEAPTDTEILEFLLERFQMHSPKMNGQHSWRFINDYCMGKAVGRSAKDAVIACMREQAKEISELEGKS